MSAALKIDDLSKSFGGLPATRHVSLEVMPGERRLIIGPNGAGKTTLFNLITGDLASDAGRIALFGTEVTKLPTHRRAHLGLARTYQIITLFNRDTLAHNLSLGLLGLSPRRHQMFTPLWRHTDMRGVALETLDRVGLKHLADRPVSEISYGEKRRVEIALALAQRPKLLLLDEPLAGLSLEERVSVQALIAAIPRETTIIMIEHDMDVALEFAERITLLHYGEVLADGTRAEVVAHPRTREVYLGH
jgi:branched-chain amino acid transport system ATP-binding protein